MKPLIIETPYSQNFKTKFDEAQSKVYDIIHLLPYNQDNVEFLSYLADNFLEGLEDYYKENVFTCKKCGNIAIEGKFCTSGFKDYCERE